MELIEARSIAAAALAQQEVEVESGFTVGNQSLADLEQEQPGRVLDLAVALGGGMYAERQLAARILARSAVPAAEKYNLAVNTLTRESDPEVSKKGFWCCNSRKSRRRWSC